MSNFHRTRRGGNVLVEAWVKGGGLAKSEVVKFPLGGGVGSSSISRTTVMKFASGKGRCVTMRACILRRKFSSGG